MKKYGQHIIIWLVLAFLYLPIKKTDLGPMFVEHPFFSSGIIAKMTDDNSFFVINLLENPQALEKELEIPMTESERLR